MGLLQSFDEARAGTSEEEWRSMLSHSSSWVPEPGRLVVVAPHPDDEVLGAGGLVSSWAFSGHPVTVVSVTDGEAADAARKGLGVIRRMELLHALRKLSLCHVEVLRLGIPDGKVTEYKNRLRNVLLERVEPGSTLIAPYEQDGHPDYEAAARLCLELAEIKKVSIARYPILAWQHSNPAKFRSVRWGLFRLASAAHRRKLRAAKCFESQMRPPHVLAHFERPYEAFVM